MRTGRFLPVAAFVLTLVISASASQSRTAGHAVSLPIAAQSRISATLGSEIPDYQARARESGFRIKNARQRLTADFAAQGVEIQAGAEHVRVQLLGYGYGDALQSVSDTVPQAISNRVEYRRGAFTEWYVNGPAGIEQGFTFAETPRRWVAEPLTIALALSGDLTATLEKDGTSLTLNRNADHAALLCYRGLTAYDTTGRQLHAWLELRGNRLLLRVHDAKAVYPIVVDPFVQHAELTSSDGASDDNFGTAVAISGNTIVVGAPNALIGTSDFSQGAAYVFVKPTTGWANMTQTAKLTASNPNTNSVHFGTSVAISGNTVVVGAPRAFIGFSQIGTAYVFVKPTSNWVDATETARLTPSDGVSGDSFGQSVAIAGTTVMVGSPNAKIGSNSGQGAVYVFTKPGTGWVNLNKNIKLTASDGQAGDSLGTSVAITGSTVVAGAPLATIGTNTHQGKSYVFVKPPKVAWKSATETAELTALDGVQGDEFGTSVAVGGTTIVIGASAEVDSSLNGSAYVYVEPAGGWMTTSAFTAKLTSSDSKGGDHFGVSVAIVGKTVAIGADQPLGTGPGAVYIYVEPTSGWATTSTFTQKLLSSDGVFGDQFGTSVAETTGRVVAGAHGHQVGTHNRQGDAYVF
jgi:hypothetical protein